MPEKKAVKKILPKKSHKRITSSQKKEAGLTVPLLDSQGNTKGTVSVSKEIFSTAENKKLLAQYVHVYLTNQRQGTASVKRRGEIQGSTRKIYRQKGTGRARHGARSAPIFVGGGVAFGPHPREYSLKLGKKQRRRAFFSALTLAHKNGGIAALVDESINIEPKTKTFSTLLKNAQLSGKKLLLVLPELKKNNLVLASRNLDRVILRDVRTLNAYDVLNTEKLLFTKTALVDLEKHYIKT